jgi:hypothetical protein
LKQLRSKILIGNYKFSNVVDLEINSSWDLLSDTAIIKLPNRFKDDNNNIVVGSSLFQRGDSVKIYIGYDKKDDDLPLEFDGYISNIEPKQVMTIWAEDYMWKLKQKNITSYSKRGITLKTLISDLLKEISETISFETIDTKLGDIQIENKTFVGVLDFLSKDPYNITSYFRDNVLYVGLNYYSQTQLNAFNNSYTVNTLKFGLEQNVPLGGNNLNFKKDTDINFVLKGVSMLDDNSKKELYAYRNNQGAVQTSTTARQGSIRTFTYYNLTLDELKETLLRIYPTIQFEGMAGNLRVFGEPRVKHGDIIQLQSFQEQDFTGSYRVKTVQTMFGNGGFFQVLTPDIAEL